MSAADRLVLRVSPRLAIPGAGQTAVIRRLDCGPAGLVVGVGRDRDTRRFAGMREREIDAARRQAHSRIHVRAIACEHARQSIDGTSSAAMRPCRDVKVALFRKAGEVAGRFWHPILFQ